MFLFILKFSSIRSTTLSWYSLIFDNVVSRFLFSREGLKSYLAANSVPAMRLASISSEQGSWGSCLGVTILEQPLCNDFADSAANVSKLSKLNVRSSNLFFIMTPLIFKVIENFSITCNSIYKFLFVNWELGVFG